jgi:hypothetical protein
MTTEALINKKAVFKKYENLYIKRMFSGVYEADWHDVTKTLLFASVDNVSKTLDFEDYAYGQIKTGHATFGVTSKEGEWERAGFVYSLFRDADARNKTKILYKAGYYDENDVKIDETVFEGLLNEKTVKTDFNTSIVNFEALAYEFVFSEETLTDVPLTDVSTMTTVSAIANADNSRLYLTSTSSVFVGNFVKFPTGDEYEIKDVDRDATGAFIRVNPSLVATVGSGAGVVVQNYNTSITSFTGFLCQNDYVTYDASLINPYFDYAIDNIWAYENKKYEEILTDIAQKSNSVWYVDDDHKLNIRAKTVDTSIANFEFIGGNAQTRNNNILMDGVVLFDDGYNRIINQVTYKNDLFETTVADSNAEIYGASPIEITGNDISNKTTATSICGIIVEQEKFPKKKIKLKTQYMPNVLSFFQPCTIDYKPALKPMPVLGLVWNGNTDFNSDYYWHVYETQQLIEPTDTFKYYGYEHNLSEQTTTHYLLLT